MTPERVPCPGIAESSDAKAVAYYLQGLMQRWHIGHNVSVRQLIEHDMIESGILPKREQW
jgi:hypothetical protein